MIFQPRGSDPPMTAAERQRRCRANGKGRHRGYRPTRAQTLATRKRIDEQIAAIEAAQGSPATPEQCLAVHFAVFGVRPAAGTIAVAAATAALTPAPIVGTPPQRWRSAVPCEGAD